MYGHTEIAVKKRQLQCRLQGSYQIQQQFIKNHTSAHIDYFSDTKPLDQKQTNAKTKTSLHFGIIPDS